MKYEIIIIDFFDAPSKEHIQIAHEDGSFESFPVDESNPRYQQFLAELEAEA